MQARILDKKEEALWANFVSKHHFATIHQTLEWGHFQEKIPGRGKYWIVILENPGRPESSKVSPVTLSKIPPDPQSKFTILGGTLLIRHSLTKGYCWLYAPRGPLLNYELVTANPALLNEQMSLLLEEIKKIAKKEKAVFLRIDPPLMMVKSQESAYQTVRKTEGTVADPSALTKLEKDSFLTASGQAKHASQICQFPHFHFTSHGFQPNETLILDLNLSEQELLAQMKQKGRYNIKLAEKKGVQIIKSTAETQAQDLQDFYQILTETTSRDGFHGHKIDFYANMLKILAPHAQLYLAKYQNQTLAGAIITYHKDTATYYYGASSNQHRELMAPYLLHWQIIKEAKENGFTSYDLFGISSLNDKNHPWKTVSEFKRKFGGTEITYQKPQEYSFKKLLHAGYRAYKKLK